ncbi:hypothetical protein BH09ACT10_BH09ACT10_19560 [soil metagenome]
MTPPTGIRSDGALIFTREYAHPVDRVWQFLSESELCGVWFGTWEGHALPGVTVPFTMTAEEEGPPVDLRVHICDGPHLLAVEMGEAEKPWRLSVELEGVGHATTVTMRHQMDLETYNSAYGPGWEYYLDRLGATLDDAPMPAWDRYEPEMLAYYEAL